MANKYVTLEKSTAVAETTEGLRVEVDGTEAWIPKSQISDESEVQARGDTGDLVITEWIAKEKGLI